MRLHKAKASPPLAGELCTRESEAVKIAGVPVKLPGGSVRRPPTAVPEASVIERSNLNAALGDTVADPA